MIFKILLHRKIGDHAISTACHWCFYGAKWDFRAPDHRSREAYECLAPAPNIQQVMTGIHGLAGDLHEFTHIWDDLMEGFILGGGDDFRMWELAGNLLEIKHSHGKSLIHDVSLDGKKVMKAKDMWVGPTGGWYNMYSWQSFNVPTILYCHFLGVPLVPHFWASPSRTWWPWLWHSSPKKQRTS